MAFRVRADTGKCQLFSAWCRFGEAQANFFAAYRHSFANLGFIGKAPPPSDR
jgi:hypothetical protein